MGRTSLGSWGQTWCVVRLVLFKGRLSVSRAGIYLCPLALAGAQQHSIFCSVTQAFIVESALFHGSFLQWVPVREGLLWRWGIAQFAGRCRHKAAAEAKPPGGSWRGLTPSHGQGPDTNPLILDQALIKRALSPLPELNENFPLPSVVWDLDQS